MPCIPGHAAFRRCGGAACARPDAPLRLIVVVAMAAALLGPPETAMAAKTRSEASQPRRVTAVVPPARAAAAAASGRATATRTARPKRQGRPAAAPAKAAPPVTSGQVLVSAIAQAARATGIDPELLVALAWQESRFDPRARNRNSSARGLMQFTEATWLEVLRDFGPRHGLGHLAARLSTDPASGNIAARDRRSLRQILGLRDNPRLATVLAAERIRSARGGLEQVLGRSASATDLYFAHLLGPAGARRFLAALEREPRRPAADAVSREGLARNREVFVARDTGRPLSLAEVHGWAGQSIAEQQDRHGPILRALRVPPRPAVVELAAAR